MKRVIKIDNAEYYVQDEDDLIFLVHLLTREGFTQSEIAYILGISRKKVQEYLEDCW
jgi:DNA-binding transcriptional regulator LsrR (DeoR family)